MSIPDPIVLLDARAKYVHPAFQMLRAAPKTTWLPADNARAEVPANAIAWDVDAATGAPLGASVEVERTNLILRSNSLDSSPWFSPSRTDVYAVEGPPAGAGLKWWRVEANEAGSGSRYVQQGNISVNSGVYYVLSFDVMYGEIPGVLVSFSSQFDQGGDTVRFWVPEAGDPQIVTEGVAEVVYAKKQPLRSGAFRVFICLRAVASGEAVVIAALKNSFGVSYNSILSIGDGCFFRAFQMEPIAANDPARAATSYIDTAGAAATRPADSLMIPDATNLTWFSPREGALLVEFFADPLMTPAGAACSIRGSSLDTFTLRTSNGNIVVSIRSANGTVSSQLAPLRSGLNRACLSFSVTGDAFLAAANGAAARAIDSPPPDVDSLSRIWAGGTGISGTEFGNRRLNGHVHRLAYYPAPIGAAALQSLTAIQE